MVMELSAARWAVLLSLVALALSVWPSRPRWPVASRLSWRPPVGRSVGMVGAATVVGVTITAMAGPLPGLSAALATATGMRLARGRRRARELDHEWTQVHRAVRMLGRELRAGAGAPDAAAIVAQSVGGPVGHMLTELAACARLQIDRPPPSRPGPTGVIARRLHAGLRLSMHHGVPWAALVEAMSRELADSASVAAQRAAQVAGPRFSGYVMAALPAFGLLLGSGMGGDPLAVLFGAGVGGVLLPIGTALICAGLLWSARIVRA